MSLLFDALKRAQGDDAKPPQDASSRRYSGSNEEAPPADARTAVTGKPNTRILPYAVAGLVLLAGGVAWVFYQKNQYAPVAPLHPVPMIEVAMVTQPPAASQPAAASGIGQTSALTSLPGTASGTDTSVNKAWTHPAASQNHKKRKSAKQPARHGILAGTDPLKEGYLALSQGRLDLAEQRYLEVLAKYPHEKDALLGLAVVAHRKLQTDRAADLYRQVLREDMGNAAAAAGLVSLSAQADPVAAESQLRELLDIKPAAPELHYALGSVLARQLRWGEAQQAFFRAYSLQPGNALYAYNLAVSLDRLHQPDAALPYYQKASSQAKPGDPTLDMVAIGRRIQELKTSH